MMHDLSGKTVLVTGGARRVGRHLCLTAARAGADVIVHYSTSAGEAETTAAEIRQLGRQAFTIHQDFQLTSDLDTFFDRCWDIVPFDILVNNASIFKKLSLDTTELEDWEQHLAVNLTAPFLLSRRFMQSVPADRSGRIINLLDWRALRPGADYFPYTVSKAGLAALTQSLAVAGAPRVTVNGLALGAILPPERPNFDADRVVREYPIQRWAELDEVGDAFLFLASGPAYMTGEVLTLDGGRHLV